MDYYVKSVIPIIESNYENFTALEKNIADFFTNSSYVPIGDDPVASPNMQSGFNVTTDAMMFAAFLLISSYDFVLIILMIFLLLMRAQCHRAWFLFSFYRVLNSKNI